MGCNCEVSPHNVVHNSPADPDQWMRGRGAALSMLPQKAIVVSTSCTKHYGVEAWEVIDPVKDYGQPTLVFLDGLTRVNRVCTPQHYYH